MQPPNPANLDPKPVPGELEKAIGQNDVQAVADLLRRGADVNETEPQWGRDMLILATDRGFVEIAGLLIDAGADINKVWGAGITPLMRAVIGRRTEVARFLIARGADIDAVSDKGLTAVGYAINLKNMEMLRLLTRSGADVSTRIHQIKKSDMQTPNPANVDSKSARGELEKAIGRNDVQAVTDLLRRGADVNETEPKWGRDMLILATDRGYVEIVRLLIDAGADVNKVWGSGMTPLMRAVIAGRTEVARVLIEHGAHINAVNDEGLTAVRHAVNSANTEILGLLIGSGADVSIADKKGNTPQRIAEIHNNALIVQMLKEAPVRQQHDLAVKNQRGLKNHAVRPRIIRGPQP